MTSQFNEQQFRKQLKNIFECAPSPHEIRILNQKYQVVFDGKPRDRYYKGGFSIGAPQNPQEAFNLIRTHFHNGVPPNNCYIVLNRVSDNYRITTKRQKIGDDWYPAIGYTLTKEQDILGYCALAIDIDRAQKNDANDEKQVASDDELSHLKEITDMVCADFAQFGLRPNYRLMSGNGFQVVYFFEQQLDIQETKGVIKNILEGVHENYHERDADIDTSLYDPPRMVRVAGTWNEKGWKTNLAEKRIVRQAYLIGETVDDINLYANIRKLEESLLASVDRYRLRNKKSAANKKPMSLAGSVRLSQAMPQQDVSAKNETGLWVDEQLRQGGRQLLLDALKKVHHDVEIAGRSGGKIQILCPYHKEKTHSAWINENKNAIPMVHCRIDGCSLHGHAKTALAVLLDNSWNFQEACQELFHKLPPEQAIPCKYCGREIIFAAESKRPLNPDHSPHSCEEFNKSRKQGLPGQEESDNRPTILLQGDLEIKSRDILAWLDTHNAPPCIFTRGREVVRLVQIDGESKQKKLSMIERMDGKKLRAFLNERIRFEKEIEKKKEVLVVTADLPLSVADHILSQASWPFPKLMEIIRYPTLDYNGKIMLTDGYNPSMQAWIDLGGFNVDVPEHPTPQEVETAKNFIIHDLLKDFPFAEEASLANTIGLILLPFVRHLIDGCTPLHLITAPVPGTGKGLLAEILSLVATGKMPTALTEGRCEEEWRKRITAALDQSPAVINIDNIRHTLDSATLASALTARIWSDRRLGSSTLITVPNNTVWIATANNPQLSMEMTRRSVWIALDPQLEEPWRRKNFKHDPLHKWVKEQRTMLVKSCLTLTQAWVKQGMPQADVHMGSFAEWAGTIGGLLQTTGIPGFLDNNQRLYLRADHEMKEWRAFVEMWWEHYHDRPVTTRDLHILALSNNLLPTILGEKDKKSQTIRLGIALTHIQNRIIACWKVEEARSDTHTHCNLWRLVKLEKDKE